MSSLLLDPKIISGPTAKLAATSALNLKRKCGPGLIRLDDGPALHYKPSQDVV